MSRKSRTTSSAVERLLEQRRLFQDWLTKLEGGVGETMPAHVVEKVRNDYRSRLTTVMAELTQHDDAIRQSLAESQAQHDALQQQQKALKDELAEVRLRKQVGELDDGAFKETNGRLKGSIDEIGKELSATLRDIDRYEEILDLIAEGVRAAPTPATSDLGAEPPAAVGEEPGRAQPTASAEEPTAVASSPAGAPGKGASQMDALDEIAFIRSVTGVAAPVRRPTRAAGKGAVSAPPPAPAKAPEPEPELEPEPQPEREAFIMGEPPAETQVVLEETPESQPAPASAETRGSKMDAGVRRSEDARAAAAEGKALVCAECGAPNLPTEWYCEKCGAELSAM
ncbi:MAG: hypothetical protein HYR48_04385 [Gemmatimonadetes bacterium]|nr:hypothetical protein [Gemmatimonadota bacterium]